jgi:hypothetical protein
MQEQSLLFFWKAIAFWLSLKEKSAITVSRVSGRWSIATFAAFRVRVVEFIKFKKMPINEKFRNLSRESSLY